MAGQTVTLTDNGTLVRTTIVEADGSFTANVTLPNQGANALVAAVTDSFGNTGTSAAVVTVQADGSFTLGHDAAD